MKYTYIILLGLLISVSCGRSHKSNDTKTSTVISEDPQLCNLKGTLEFHPESSNSKCFVVVILEEGERILPTNGIDVQANFKDGQHVELGIDWLKSDGQLCHNTTAHVRVKCMIPFDLPYLKNTKECVNPLDPHEVAWMNHIIISMKPTKIVKYEFGNELAYQFIQKKNEAIYTCKGELICTNVKADLEDCSEWMDEMKNPEVILVVNN